MKRTNRTQLDALAATINVVTKSPQEAVSGRHWNTGCFFISINDAGFDLQRVSNASGGSTSFLNTGHIPARRLAMLMNVFILGLTLEKEEKRRRESMTPTDLIEEKLREYASQHELTYIGFRKIVDEDIELLVDESPKYRLGYLSDADGVVLPGTFHAYLQQDEPFTEKDTLPFYRAMRLAHQITHGNLKIEKPRS